MLASLGRTLAWYGIAASLAASASPTCDETIRIPVSATALNKVLPNLNLSSLSISDHNRVIKEVQNAPTKEVSGDYVIAARYCEPENKVASRSNTLQVLVHGITFTRDYWSGLGPPGQQFNGTYYSWIDYASKQGYPTLSVDRICNGASSHPNGLLVCQIPMNAETMYQVINAARAGQIGGRKFDQILYIGHSEGSFTGNSLAQSHPDAVDTYVLTGFSDHLYVGAVGTAIAAVPFPAIVVNPVKYATLPDPTYLLSTSRRGLEGLTYYGGYSEQVVDEEVATAGTVTLGEFISAFDGQIAAPGFMGNFLVLTGQQDQIVCARKFTDPIVGFKGNCGSGASSFTSQTRSLYPNAKFFDYYNVNQTGHNENLHYSSQEVFKVAHDFLAARGY